MKKIITILALSLVSVLQAHEPLQGSMREGEPKDPLAFRNDSALVAEDVSFSHFSVFLEGGEIYPMGDLMDHRFALLDAKYQVTKIQPVDMFPHTQHVENVVLLELKSPITNHQYD